MKNIILLLCCILIGILVFIAYAKITAPKINPALIKPTAKTIPFSLEKAPTESLKGTISSLFGSVEWESRVATEPAEITVPQEIQQGEILVTKETGKTVIDFPNTTTIIMSPNTTVNFIQTLPSNFVLSQIGGKAEYKNIGTSPLSVRVMSLVIQQQAADTIITVDEEQPIVYVSVRSGPITAAFNSNENLSNVLTINTGETLTYNSSTDELDIE